MHVCMNRSSNELVSWTQWRRSDTADGLNCRQISGKLLLIDNTESFARPFHSSSLQQTIIDSSLSSDQNLSKYFDLSWATISWLLPHWRKEWAHFLAASNKWLHIGTSKQNIRKYQKCLFPQKFLTVFVRLSQWKSFRPFHKFTMQCKRETKGQVRNLSSIKTLFASEGRTPREPNCAWKLIGLTPYPAEVTHLNFL